MIAAFRLWWFTLNFEWYARRARNAALDALAFECCRDKYHDLRMREYERAIKAAEVR